MAEINTSGSQADKQSFSSEIKRLIPILAQTTASLLLSGEKGCGKSFIASSIHRCVSKNPDNFFEINCKSFDQAKSAEAFSKIKAGIGQLAADERATFFIGCINLMSLELQTQLLDFLKVLVLCDSMGVGGAETHVMGLVKGLAKEGVSVVLATRAGELSERLADECPAVKLLSVYP